MNSIKNPIIIKCLDINIGHILYDDVCLLKTPIGYNYNNPVISYMYEEGYLTFIPDEDQNEIISNYGYSENFLNILKIGRKNYCVYILLDRDATQYEDLEFFNW
jgi:hypothetical protein